MMQPKGQKIWPLTKREEQILKLAAEGYEDVEIASRLGMDLRTVRQHQRNVLEKLEIHDFPAAIEYVLREGIITAYEILESRYSEKRFGG
jgi:DNA-binding NarL/FixJ family response regulator